MSRKIEIVFAALFALFFTFWLTFDLPVALGLVQKSAGWYAREVEPIYLDPPAWLDSFVWFPVAYGPFYLLTAYGFFRSRSWLPYLLLPLAGMVVASTAIYIAIEATGDVPPSNWTIFYVFNGLYIVVPSLAAIWLIGRTRTAGTAGSTASA